MTGVVAYSPWMDKSAVGVLWQGDANFAHTCKKIEIRFVVGNLMPSGGQFAWRRFLRTRFCCPRLFLSKLRRIIIFSKPPHLDRRLKIWHFEHCETEQLSLPRWFITRWSPPSHQSTVPGLLRPPKGSCGGTRAAEGPARWKVIVTACVCWLQI